MTMFSLLLVFVLLVSLSESKKKRGPLPTPFPTHTNLNATTAPTQLPTTTTTTTAATTSSATVPAGCPATSTLWSQQTPAQVAALQTDCFASLSVDDTEQLVAIQCAAISPVQLAAFTSGCSGLFGDCVSALSLASLAQLPVACAQNLTARALAGLRVTQVPSLSAAVLSALPPSAVSALSPACVAALSNAQFNSLTQDQLLYLTESQLAVLSPALCASFSALQTTFLAPASCAGLNASCVLAFQSWNGLQGGCVGTFASDTLLRAPAGLLNSISNAGWSGVTAAQFEALVDNSTSFKLLEALPMTQVAEVDPRVIGRVSQYFLAQNMTTLNVSTVADARAFFTNSSWITVAQIVDITTVNVESWMIAAFPPSSVSALRGLAVKNLPAEAYAGFNSAQLAAMQPEAVGNISGPGVVYIEPAAFVGLCAQIDQLSIDATVNTTLAQLGALAASGCRGDQVCNFLRNVSDKQRDVAAANSTVFVQFDESCGLTGTLWVNTMIIVMCIAVVVVFISCCVVVEVRRKRRNAAARLR
jgi:trimeric autotransporter adhesin